MKDIIIDIETLSTKRNAVIVSIAAVLCDVVAGNHGEKLHITLDVQKQIDAGYAVDASTLAFWLKQDEAARNYAAGIIDQKDPNIVDRHQAMFVLHQFIKGAGNDVQVWGNGISFDLGLIHNDLIRHGGELPWEFWNERDVRTTLDNCLRVTGHKPTFTPPKDAIKHHPVDDCLYELGLLHDAHRRMAGVSVITDCTKLVTGWSTLPLNVQPCVLNPKNEPIVNIWPGYPMYDGDGNYTFVDNITPSDKVDKVDKDAVFAASGKSWVDDALSSFKRIAVEFGTKLHDIQFPNDNKATPEINIAFNPSVDSSTRETIKTILRYTPHDLVCVYNFDRPIKTTNLTVLSVSPFEWIGPPWAAPDMQFLKDKLTPKPTPTLTVKFKASIGKDLFDTTVQVRKVMAVLEKLPTLCKYQTGKDDSADVLITSIKPFGAELQNKALGDNMVKHDMYRLGVALDQQWSLPANTTIVVDGLPSNVVEKMNQVSQCYEYKVRPAFNSCDLHVADFNYEGAFELVETQIHAGKIDLGIVAADIQEALQK